MKPHPRVKTSLAPGSKVVTAYLKQAGLLPYLEQLGYHVVAYGCTSCMGLAGPLDKDLEDTIVKNDVISAAVLSGNRNFEARVHQSLKANFLMSPPLVVAFALAGTVRINVDTDPLGKDKDGKPVFLKDIWPTPEEVDAAMSTIDAEMFRSEYANAFAVTSPTADILTGVKVDPSVAAMAQMHETVMDNGAMKMQEVASVDLPAGTAVEFKPGGYHVMFMDLKTPLQQGRSVKGTLVFEKAGTVEVEYAVEAMGGSAPAHRGH